MKKIVFVDIPMRELNDNSKQCYANTGNTKCKYNVKIFISCVFYIKIR